MQTLYERVAEKITRQIDVGAYRSGDRLPGVRKLSVQFAVSISTVTHALSILENSGLVVGRARSGFYVRARLLYRPGFPAISSPPSKPMAVKGWDVVGRLLKATGEPDFVHFGAAIPPANLLPVKAVQRAMVAAAKRSEKWLAGYSFSPGLPELRRQLARRMMGYGCQVNPDDIIATNGCTEAYSLALRAVAEPGDVIAIESPCYYGLLQVLESLGMKAMEIPTDSNVGISLPALKTAIGRWPVKACVLVTNFSNPLGYCMPDEKKRELVEILALRKIPLIEDDIYGDLCFGGERPRPARAFDAAGNVLYCSSFSKTISPALRLGWIDAGIYKEKLEFLKYASNMATPTFSQLVIANILEHGGYERYLRQVRPVYERLVRDMIQAVGKYFPKGTKVTQPHGGFAVWVEMPKRVDALVMFEDALAQRISIAPGPAFSASQKYKNFIRLNCALPWNEKAEKALVTLGRIAEKLNASPPVKNIRG
jgi:DNA-binding transcriptional MocR family regulator